MIEILVACLTCNLIYLAFGTQFYSFSFGDKGINNNISEKSLFGIIIISFIALIINFFTPLDKLVGTFLIAISIVILLTQFYLYRIKKNLIIFILVITFLSFLLILLSNINRPDAGLYHLPYTSLINENKIIIGSSNIHFRFGHISILQYLSAINNNHLFSTASITIPIASVVSIFLYHSIIKIYNFLEENKVIESFIVFLIAIFSFYSFNRYSNFGNDSSTSIYFFILSIYFLGINSLKNIDKIQFYKISFLSIFLFSLKTFMVVSLIIPFIIFLFSNIKKKLILNKNFLICLLFFVCWILKNILISSCVVYPLTFTCIKNFKHYNNDTTIEAKNASEAWSKGWSDQKNEILSYKKYNKNFNWVKTWQNKHLKKIIEKFLPFIIFSLLLLAFLVLKSFTLKKKINNYYFDKKLIICFIFSNFFLLLWFLKFPLYRYGQSFIALSYIFTFVLVFKKFINLNDKILLKKIYKFTLCIGLAIFLFKNGFRIIDNKDIQYFDYPWPKIYSLENEKLNKKQKFTKIVKDNRELYYYTKGELCMYSKSPCSNYLLNDLKNDKFFNYKIYWIRQ